jgi:hypothetical protein
MCRKRGDIVTPFVVATNRVWFFRDYPFTKYEKHLQ